MSSHMHVERRGICAQQVVMNCGDLQSAFDQLDHHWVDFSFKKDEVAHDHGAAMHRLEGNPPSEGKCRFDGDTIKRHRKIAARKSITMDVARYGRFSAERCVDFLPVDFLSTNRG